MRPRFLPADQDPERIARRRRRTVRWIVVILVLVGVFSLGFFLSDVFNPLLIGLGLAYIFNPAVEALERRKIKRGIAVSLLFGAVFVVVGAVVSYATLKAAGHLLELRGSLTGEPVLDPEDPDDALILKQGHARIDPDDPRESNIAPVVSASGEQFLDYDGNGKRKIGRAEEAIHAITDTLSERFDIQDLALGTNLKKLARAYQDHASEVLRMGIKLTAGVQRSFTKVGHFFSYALLVPIYTFFLLLYFTDIVRWVRDHLPGSTRDEVVRIAKLIDVQVAAFFRGKLAVVLLKGVATWIGLWIAGVPFAFFIGMGAGLLSIIPMIGPVIGGGIAILLSYSSEGWLLNILWVVLAFGFAEVVEAVAQPLILGEAVGLSPLSLILSLFVFGKLLGFFGVLLAVPISCVVKTLFAELLLPQIKALAEDPGGGAASPTQSNQAVDFEPAVPSFGSPST